MEYAGKLVTAFDGFSPVNGYFGILSADGKTMLAGPTDTEGSFFHVTPASDQELLFFGAPGYVDQVFTQQAYKENGPVIVLKKGFPLWIAAGVLIIIIYQYMQRKKISGLSQDDIYPIFLLGGGVIGFFLLKQLFEKLGIWRDADQKALDAAATSPTSFWNPNYWKQAQSYSYAMTTEQANAYADQINDAFGAFNDNEAAVIGIFRSLQTKANVSFLAYCFQNKYGQDLLTFLRGGIWPQDRLSDADVSQINSYVNHLPNF